MAHRHDLMEFSCVNNEIRSFNRKLMKYVKTFKHTTFLEINSNRKIFTLHGVHLNGLGKEMSCKQIVSQVYTILGKRSTNPNQYGLEKGFKRRNNKKCVLCERLAKASARSGWKSWRKRK